jgi:hydrogenase-4 component B
MDQQALLLAGFAVLLLGALATFAFGGPGKGARVSRYLALLAVAGAAACFLTLSARILLDPAAGEVQRTVLWQPSLLNASLAIKVDALSAFFLIIISGLSIASTWYAVAYTSKIEGGLRGFYPPMLLFIMGMAGVVVLDDFFFFFVPWEFMALSSYLLVVFHREKAENLAAGFKYFFLTHAGTLALFFGVTLVVVQGAASSFGFEDLSAALPTLLAARPVFAHFALALIFLGFLVKAGGFPFGMWWLPDAHPAAPSPVSALLSGAMIKLGLYGIVRVFFTIVPPGPWLAPWGFVVAAFGTLSLFFGTMAALVQLDSKRLLAYHSIGQVGYMLLGFGLGLGLLERDATLAAVAVVAGLFHLLNHACFKGLLFLDAGVFEVVTGERDLNRLGGLNKVVAVSAGGTHRAGRCNSRPLTAACTIVASLSIAGLPPFNGFSSKWLLYHAAVWSGRGTGVIYLLFGIVAIFISAVTLASFLKFMGSTIWGAPSPAARRATGVHEGPWLGGSQIVLALLCVGLGLFPYAGTRLCYQATGAFAAARPAFATLFGASPLAMQVSDRGAIVGLWSPLVVGSILVAAFALALAIRKVAAAPRRAVDVWSCGSELAHEELRFKAAGYYTPFKKFVHALVPQRGFPWPVRPWPIVTRVLNPDGWAYEPLAANTLRLFRWLATSRLGFQSVYPAWTLIGLAICFIGLFVLR